MASINFIDSDPVWLPGTDWIAFTAHAAGESRWQLFIIHQDGTELTQITHSKIGVLDFLPYFDGGIYWEEGFSSIEQHASWSYGYYWTKLDGSETKSIEYKPSFDENMKAWSPDGLALIIKSKDSNGNNVFYIMKKNTGEQIGLDFGLDQKWNITKVFWLPFAR